MKSFVFSALLIALAIATNGEPVKRTQGTVEITFIGAANAQFTQSFPVDGSIVQISMSIQMHIYLKLP